MNYGRVYKISTNSMEIFGQATRECLLFSGFRFIRGNDQPNIFHQRPRSSNFEIRQDLVFNLMLLLLLF